MTELSPFATALRGLFDETGYYSRSQWATFLGVSPDIIETWLTDKAIPVHHLLRMTLDLLRTRGELSATEALNVFDDMAMKPATEISPHPRLLPTVRDYLNIKFTEFAKLVGTATADHRIAVLTKGSWPL